MNIQIFGIKKCFDTKKAERYFKERNIKYQFIDLSIKQLSKRELESVELSVGIKDLINVNSADYKKSNMGQVRSKEIKLDILLNNYKLYKTPIVRNGKEATVGYKPEVWGIWD